MKSDFLLLVYVPVALQITDFNLIFGSKLAGTIYLSQLLSQVQLLGLGDFRLRS